MEYTCIAIPSVGIVFMSSEIRNHACNYTYDRHDQHGSTENETLK